MFFLYFNPDFCWCYFLELPGLKWRVTKHVRVLKNKKLSVFFSAYLFGFLLFFLDSSSHYVSLTSWHLLFFWGLCVFLNFLVINELSIKLVTTRFQVFEGNSWSCSMFLILFFYFYGDFLFVLYSSPTFTHIYSV